MYNLRKRKGHKTPQKTTPKETSPKETTLTHSTQKQPSTIATTPSTTHPIQPSPKAAHASIKMTLRKSGALDLKSGKRKGKQEF